MSVDVTEFIEESLAAGRGWRSEAERAEYLASLEEKKFAIFAEDASEMNPEDIDAFNSMIYDNRSPAELMTHFRDQGNRHFANAKRNKMYFRDALVMYGKALQEAKALDVDFAASDEGQMELSKLWSNCAAANLKLRNWASTIKAADAALSLWEGNVKAAYRKVKALVELKRYEEAAMAAAQALQQEPENKELAKLQRTAQRGFLENRRREEAKVAAVMKRQQPILDLGELSRTVGVLLGAPDKNMTAAAGNHALASARPKWRTDGAERLVQWPLLFLYPEYSQSDVVTEALASDMLAEWLGRVLPEEEEAAPAWDERREYRGSNVDAFFKINSAPVIRSEEETLLAWGVSEAPRTPAKDSAEAPEASQSSPMPEERQQAWIPVHPGCTLSQIVTFADHVLVGGVVALTIVPREGEAHRRFLADAREFTRGVEDMLQPA